MPSDLPHRRALIVGALGPGIFLFGLVWTLLRLLLADPVLSLRAIAFAPPHQLMVVGLIVSIICVPVAKAIAGATPEELDLPGFEAKLPAASGQERASAAGQKRRSYQSYN